jgi:hypothetical protein
MVVDVSGDTDVSVVNVGLAPVHAVQQTANQVLVVNHSATGALADSITKLTFNSILISGSSTISLPANSAPNFVATTESSQAYVSLPSYVPDPVNNPGVVVPSVGVVNTNSNSLINTIPVGINPVAIAETPNSQKLYVANQGDNTVMGFNTVDRSARTILTFSAPVWLAARSDSQRLYVLNGPGGTNPGVVSTVDTTLTAGPDSVIDASITAPGAAFMLYDGNLNRLYIPWFNQSAQQGQLTILDVSQSTPQPLGGSPITITPVSPSTRAQGDVCSTFSPAGVTAAAVAALPDGSRAYVGSYAEFTVKVTISNATLNSDGIHTTYTYSLPPATLDLLPGMVITISGVDSTNFNANNTPPSDFDGTFTIISVGGGTFEVANAPIDTYISGGAGSAPNICPQVTVINATGNTIKTPQITIPGVPGYEPFCATTRFRLMMAAAGDSSRAYLSSCDGGNVNIIDTSSDTYIGNLPAPVGSRLQNPPQNPVFLIAGP